MEVNIEQDAIEFFEETVNELNKTVEQAVV